MPKRHDPPDADAVTEQIRRSLRVLGLTHTLTTLDAHPAWAAHDQPAAGVLLARVLGEEAAHKLEHRIERRIGQSGLRERKTLETLDWPFPPRPGGEGRPATPPPRPPPARRACQQQMRVRYARCVDLLDDLYAGLADGTYPKRLHRWASVDLLIIDDVGLGQVKKREGEPTAAHTLYDLIDRRHAKLSTAVTSNIELSAWGRYLGDVTLTVAILDRLPMHAVRIDIDGPSFRKHVGDERAKKQGRKLPSDSTRDARG